MNFHEKFTFEELTNSSNHAELVAQNREDATEYITMGKRLSHLLGAIRDVLGSKPISVSSGFRNLPLNAAVGSKAKHSDHLEFKAADIVPSHISVDEAFRLLQENKHLLKDLRKVIIEKVGSKKWLHVVVKSSLNEPTEFYTTLDGKHFNIV